MHLFLDTADIATLKQLARTGLIDGVTTNPSLIAASGEPILETIKAIAATIPGPVSAEVVATDVDGMLSEAATLSKLAPNVVIKLPLTESGLIVCCRLSDKNIRTNVTLCFSASQALLAAKAGATYISPFVGRMEDNGLDGLGLISDIRTIYDNYAFDTQILFASTRKPEHIVEAAKRGADAITLPPQLFTEMFRHNLTDQGLEKFLADWQKTGQKI